MFALALWAQTNALIGSFYDDGIYVTLAKALAEGQGYRNINLPGAPAGVHYPVLYPAVLAVLWRTWPSFPANAVLFQLCDSALLGVSAWLIARSSERWPTSRSVRVAALALGFLAFPLLTMIGVRFSEPLFLVLAVAAASIADREHLTVTGVVAAGVLAGLAVLARSIGVSVVGGIVLALWLRRERRAAFVALATATLVLAPWFVWTATHGHEIDHRIAANYGTYATDAGQAGLGAFIRGLNFGALSPLARLAIPILPLWLWYPMALLLAAMAVWGAVRIAPRAPALVASTAFYVTIVSLWPFVPDRFMWIMMPLLALFVAEATSAAWHRGLPGRVVVGILGLVLATGYLRREVVSLGGRYFARTAEDASTPIRILAPAIAAGTPENAVIASEAEAGIYLYSGRHAVPSTLFRWNGRETLDLPVDTVVQYYCDAGVTYIALPGPTGGAAPVVDRLRLRGDSSVVRVFAITGGPALYRFRCPT